MNKTQNTYDSIVDDPTATAMFCRLKQWSLDEILKHPERKDFIADYDARMLIAYSRLSKSQNMEK